LWPDTEIAQETSSHQDSTRDIITPSPEKKENITITHCNNNNNNNNNNNLMVNS